MSTIPVPADAAPPRRTTHTWQAGGRRLVYDRWGTTGRPVLLLHGLLLDRTMWWPVAAELAADCTLIAPDLPGHGDTPAWDETCPAVLVMELAALVDGLGLRRAPVVAGHRAAAVLGRTFVVSIASQALVTVDEIPPGPGLPPASTSSAPTGAASTAAGHDPALAQAYQAWFAGPVALPAGTPHREVTGRVAADPVRFAATLRELL